jgi:hypothetical protein
MAIYRQITVKATRPKSSNATTTATLTIARTPYRSGIYEACSKILLQWESGRGLTRESKSTLGTPPITSTDHLDSVHHDNCSRQVKSRSLQHIRENSRYRHSTDVLSIPINGSKALRRNMGQLWCWPIRNLPRVITLAAARTPAFSHWPS